VGYTIIIVTTMSRRDFIQAANKPVISERVLTEEASHIVGPLLPCWQALASIASQVYLEEGHLMIAGCSLMSARDVHDGCHALFYVYSARSFSLTGPNAGANAAFVDPRYAGASFAVHALFPTRDDPYADPGDPGYGVRDERYERDTARKVFKRAFLAADETLFEAASVDGIDSEGWEKMAHIALEWMRVWRSSRIIQRAWRAYRSRVLQGCTCLNRDVADIVVGFL